MSSLQRNKLNINPNLYSFIVAFVIFIAYLFFSSGGEQGCKRVVNIANLIQIRVEKSGTSFQTDHAKCSVVAPFSLWHTGISGLLVVTSHLHFT